MLCCAKPTFCTKLHYEELWYTELVFSDKDACAQPGFFNVISRIHTSECCCMERRLMLGEKKTRIES